jgi:hypothetical protein
MRDPYEILRLTRVASFEEIKSAYRRACKQRHPDLGGSHEAMTELNTAYAFVLDELKQGYQRRQQQQKEKSQGASTDGGFADVGSAEQKSQSEEDARRYWRKAYQEIDDELDALRRAAQDYEDRLRAMRQHAWDAGDRAAWARLTLDDLADFFQRIARSGLKGLTLLFAAVVGVGSVLIESNIVSALIMLGSGMGLLVSLALKSDKGGYMSAGLLLFGLMTIWLPPVRAALLGSPLATISALICLGLIFKFVQGGIAGLATGGVLALYVLSVIVEDTQRPRPSLESPPRVEAKKPDAPTKESAHPLNAPPQGRPSSPPASQSVTFEAPLTPPQQPQPEIRELIATDGAVLKFVSGVPYRLKVRSGYTTTITATRGSFVIATSDRGHPSCIVSLDISTQTAGNFSEFQHTLRACGGDAVARVIANQ